MKLKIPFTSIELCINFEKSAGSPPSQRDLAILDDISYKALQRQFLERIHSVIYSDESTKEGVASRCAAVKGVEEMLESNQLGQDDFNRALSRVVRDYKLCALYGYGGQYETKHISDLAIILHQAGGQFSKRSIKAVFIAEDRGLHRAASLLRYLTEKELIDQNTALSFSRSAKTSDVKQLMAFVFGGHVYGRFGSEGTSHALIRN